MLIDRGKILKKVVEDSKIPLTKIAAEMGISTKTIYRHYNVRDIEDGRMLEYGRVLRHDFTVEIPELAETLNILRDPRAKYYTRTREDLIEEIESWKYKYIELLEKYNRVVEEKLENQG